MTVKWSKMLVNHFLIGIGLLIVLFGGTLVYSISLYSLEELLSPKVRLQLMHDSFVGWVTYLVGGLGVLIQVYIAIRSAYKISWIPRLLATLVVTAFLISAYWLLFAYAAAAAVLKFEYNRFLTSYLITAFFAGLFVVPPCLVVLYGWLWNGYKERKRSIEQ